MPGYVDNLVRRKLLSLLVLRVVRLGYPDRVVGHLLAKQTLLLEIQGPQERHVRASKYSSDLLNDFA